jgi:Glucose/sorbosone dehydrogenases
MPVSPRAVPALLAAFLPVASPNAQELPRDAAKLYAQLCASCHGDNLEGGLGGSLIDGVWRYGDGGDAYLAKIIADGLPDADMPGFAPPLDASRIRALTVFLREKETRAKERTTTYTRPSENQVVTSEAVSFRLETLATGLDIPWSIAFVPGTQDILVAERDGRLLVLRDGKLLPDPVAGTPKVAARGQGGLMVVAPHPDHAQPGNGWIYLAFSDPGENGEAMTAIVRGRIRDGKWVDQEDIFRAPKSLYRRGGAHFGTRLVFDQGYLFFGIGDRGASEHAQDLSRPNGKIHRIHDDGRVPADNPFVDTPGAFPSIWTYGNRNPQGLAARPGTTGDTLQLWETEHGPRGGDELNLIKRGANYGWPLVTHGMNYNGTPVSAETAREGLEQPVLHWTPSIAACGLAFYDGDHFPAWKGNLFTGSLAQQELRRIVLDGDKVKSQEVLFRGIGRIRSVQTGPDGFLYLTLEGPGRIVRLVPE